MPGCNPEPENVFKGRSARAVAFFCCLANEARNASSITSRIEQRRWRDTFRAFSKSASSIVRVVLMHQSILTLHHDVKTTACLPACQSLSPLQRHQKCSI